MPEGDKRDLFFALYNRAHKRIFAYLYVIVHNSNDAEDICQDTASLMWEKFDQFKEGTNFEAWAIAIARNKALEFLRKNNKSRMIFNDHQYDLISKQAVETTQDVSDRLEVMKGCIKKLSESDNLLLTKRFNNNLSLKQISLSCGRSSSSICQSLTRILGVLRLCINRTLNHLRT